MKKYFVQYGEGNAYNLWYTEDGSKPSGEGWERITRKKAEALARTWVAHHRHSDAT